MNDRDSALSQMFDMAVAVTNGGVNVELAATAVGDTLAALAKQAKALKDAEYSGVKEKTVHCPECDCVFTVPMPNVDALSKTMANTAKVVDETARLVQYTNGKPDQRMAVEGLDWLQALTNEQLAIVQGWVEATKHEHQ